MTKEQSDKLTLGQLVKLLIAQKKLNFKHRIIIGWTHVRCLFIKTGIGDPNKRFRKA